MNTHNLQTDKLDLIGWIYSLQDASLIENLKEFQKNTTIKMYEASLKPMSKKELVTRAKEANKAISNNEVISQEELKKESKNW
jgi:hypothetical protein